MLFRWDVDDHFSRQISSKRELFNGLLVVVAIGLAAGVAAPIVVVALTARRMLILMSREGWWTARTLLPDIAVLVIALVMVVASVAVWQEIGVSPLLFIQLLFFLL